MRLALPPAPLFDGLGEGLSLTQCGEAGFLVFAHQTSKTHEGRPGFINDQRLRSAYQRVQLPAAGDVPDRLIENGLWGDPLERSEPETAFSA